VNNKRKDEKGESEKKSKFIHLATPSYTDPIMGITLDQRI